MPVEAQPDAAVQQQACCVRPVACGLRVPHGFNLVALLLEPLRGGPVQRIYDGREVRRSSSWSNSANRWW